MTPTPSGSPMNQGPRPGGSPMNTSPKNDQTRNIVLIVVGVLLLAALGFFATKYFSTKNELEATSASADSLTTEISELEAKMTSLETTIADKDKEIGEKNQLLDEKLAKLNNLNAKIGSLRSSGKISDEKARTLQGKIDSITAQLEAYKQQIAELQAKNQELTGQVGNLTATTEEQKQAISKLEQDKAAEIAQKEQVTKEKEQVTKEKEQTQQQLSQTTEKASVLKAAEFDFFNVKKSGKAKEEYDRDFSKMWMNDVKVCFKVMENAVAKSGPREAYLVYENPNGTVRKSPSSGTFTYNGKTMTYTSKVNFTYNQTTQQVCNVIQKKDEKFEKGKQTVSVYCDGTMIGAGQFNVK